MKSSFFVVLVCVIAIVVQARERKRRYVDCPPPSRRLCRAGESTSDDCSESNPCPGCFLCCQHPCAMRCYDPVTQYFYRYPQKDLS